MGQDIILDEHICGIRVMTMGLGHGYGMDCVHNGLDSMSYRYLVDNVLFEQVIDSSRRDS